MRIRLLLPASLVAGTVGAGTIGYYLLWRGSGGTLLDALFMTVTTVTTIGYGEVRPLDAAGRIFTMCLALTGVASLFYTMTVVMDTLVRRQLDDPTGRRRVERQMERREGHVIVAGLGRVGRQAAHELAAGRTAVVTVDPGEAAADHAEEHGYLHLAGDATEDAVLERAGIRRARGLVVTTANDATNMYIVLSARVLNPNLQIVSRAVDEASVTKLMRAGATRAISPYAIGGNRLAHLILNPSVVDFFETALRRGNEALAIEDLVIRADSPAAGKTLESLDVRRNTGATVLAILRDGNPLVSPAADFTLQVSDQILALGTTAQLQQLERLIGGRPSR